MELNGAYHELRGGDIFRELVFKKSLELISGNIVNLAWAHHAARIAITAAANNIGVYEAAGLMDYHDCEEDINETDEDIYAIADWLIEGLGWNDINE